MVLAYVFVTVSVVVIDGHLAPGGIPAGDAPGISGDARGAR
jgi:hypothetical protein